MTSFPKWLRVALPILLIGIWLGIGGVGGPTFGKLSEVTSNDQATFLPAQAESTKVQKLQAQFNDGAAIPAIIVSESNQAITASQLQQYGVLARQLAQVKGVQQAGSSGGLVVGPIPSQDKHAVEFIVPVTQASELKTVVADLRTIVDRHAPTDTKTYVAGPAGLSADLVKAFGGIDGILLLVAVGAVFIILLAVYRSIILPFLVLLTSIFALSGAILVIYQLAKHGVIQLNGQSQGILSILVIGAATDYSLLLVARYRESLEHFASKWEALLKAVKLSFEPILASAATVILALLCLLFSDLNSNRSLGPIAAIGIAFAFIASMSLLPALLFVFGRASFWPSKLKRQFTVVSSERRVKTGLEDLTGFWRKVGGLVASHPRRVWLVTALALIIAASGVMQFKANGVPQTDIILAQSDAVDGQKVIAKHFDAGSGTPVVVIAEEAGVGQVLSTIGDQSGIATITTLKTGNSPKVVNGNVLINATLTSEADSAAAENTVKDLRAKLAVTSPTALVGGSTALAVDTTATARHDLIKIVPIVLVVILVVLMALLRSILAPVLLILTVILSFGATLGISALVFNHLFHFPGADATVPLFGFVFLVALGIDYNIFLMTRAREEAFKYGTKPAMLHALGKTGGVISSAGVVLAATFAALGIIPILFLAQIAFIVAFGVLLDTLIVRSLLVPALVHDIGRYVWWPSRRLDK